MFKYMEALRLPGTVTRNQARSEKKKIAHILALRQSACLLKKVQPDKNVSLGKRHPNVSIHMM